jgi:hypothetical protein
MGKHNNIKGRKMNGIAKIASRSGIAFLDFYGALPEQFSTSEAIRAGEDVGVNRITVFNWIRNLGDQGLVVRTRRGEYYKINEEG